MKDPRPFSEAILRARQRGVVPLVADIKPISPRDGRLVGARDPAELATVLAGAGACALSAVTEGAHFGGSLEMLRRVARSVDLPVLRKDFITAVDQIDDSHAAGAKAVLLILATIGDTLLPALYRRTRALGMEAVLEVHTRQELARALALAPTIVGINNRDIRLHEKDAGDVRVTEALAPRVPAGRVVISESALQTGEDIRRALAAGATAVLVGTAILQAADPATRVRELIAAGAEGIPA